ncbi:MAG TPA: aldo/keto reductase [Candidatus Sphingobacterium stercorigallinarum]|nr:aldo/keto reductase [Candidatus Sphingobacterium stercorigallinarum]
MQYKILGNSTLELSEIGLGAMSLSVGDKNTNRYIIDAVKAVGINYIDTADLYDHGENESVLGDLLQGERQDWILASKVGNRWRKDGSGWDWAASKNHILKAIDESLRRLKTDYIDLYQLHGGTLEDPYDEIVETFERLVEEGKIRYYGLSSIRPNIFLRYAAETQIVSNMMQYSLFDRRPEEYLDQLDSHQVGVIARGPIAQGLLLGKPANEYLGYSSELVEQIQNKLQETADDLGVSTLSLALKYPVLQESVRCSVIGIRTKKQADDIASVISDWDTIDLTAYREILRELPAVRYDLHRE